ncbi:MAG: S-layer homology domain-containing protein, partial [Clostridia bacterium]|nr:S-layer homology domain-containing protein [Clostridia bacterium]
DYLAEELNIELNSNGVYTYHESVEKVQQIIENSTDKDNMSYIDFTPVDGERPDRENTETTEYVTVTFDPKNGNPATVQRNFSGDAIDAPTAPAREDYIFLGWSADGVTAVTFPYTVTDDITLTALWKQDYSDFYTAMRNYRMQNMYLDFSASAGTGGTISGAGTTKLERGNTITYVINPDEGYEIADVLVDGESVGAVSEYTFENASRKHTIEAVFAEAAPEVLYEDVAETDWFHEAVVYVTGNGIMNGTAENETFAPDMTATRGMLVTMLWRLAGSPAAADGTDFSDVPADAWYAEAVKWASANGIVMGSDGRFSPEDPITREQTAAILHRYTVYAGTDDGTDLPMLPQYICSTWAENDVIWADAAGLFDGIGNDMSDLTTEASRAEIAVMLWHTGTLIGRTAE